MIRFICPDCKEIVEAPPECAGKQARCGSCGQMVPVPALAPPLAIPLQGTGARGQGAERQIAGGDAQSGTLSSLTPDPSPLTPGKGATAPRPLTTIQLACSGCGQWLDVGADQFGKLVRCPGCGQSMRTPLPAGFLVEPRRELPAADAGSGDERLPVRGLAWVLAGGLLGVLLGTGIGLRARGDLEALARAVVGMAAGAGIGAAPVLLWAFRLGALGRAGPWLTAGAIAGAAIGAALLAREPGRPAALAGALIGGLAGAVAGLGAGWIWRRLDNRAGPPSSPRGS
ncbi:MAG TPA: hypothetical protein VNK04_12850 [Gemmataceae bacterium]|nr:hypothetical protein [Gemmataceae bacterium]